MRRQSGAGRDEPRGRRKPSGRAPERLGWVADPVTVLETGDAVLLAIAKATLDSAGIAFVAKGEGIQDLFGVGRIPGGVNFITGPVQLQVAIDHAADARRFLRDLTQPPNNNC